MNKRTVIIITIITSVLSLIYILLSYFGVNRYVSLYMDTGNKLVSEYKTLPNASDDYKTIISIPYPKSGASNVKPMINSLLDQTVKVNQIVMTIPIDYASIPLPKCITDIAIVVPTGKTIGKTSCIIPVLLREKQDNVIVISLNTGYVYGKDFIETMIDEMHKHPDDIIISSDKSSMLCTQKHVRKTDTDVKLIDKKHIVKYTENYKIIT